MAEDISEIRINVTLDSDKIPSKITWSASDKGPDSKSEAKAILLSLFDVEQKDTLKIDLWTKEMQVNEMDRFFYNTLRALADTYVRATGNEKLAGAMQQFAAYFGEQSEVLKKETKS
ncbi:MAG: gliding motility protein GldC [Bacteroidetes bacterium]|nr:MAG: gliding motility protein GldC [Bacteroidota bacterium]